MPETGTLAPLRRAVLFVLLAAGWVSCTDLSEYDNRQIRSALNDTLIVTTESWDVEMVIMQEKNPRILIEGSYALSYQTKERKFTNIDGPVYVQLFDSTGAIETEAWSKRAVYHEVSGEFELFDSVRVHTVTNRRLYSDYLKWIQDTDRITSPQFVTIITPADSITGKGFNGLTDLSTWTITDPRGRVIVN